jgi:LCP family protein required for cell wall assembly
MPKKHRKKAAKDIQTGRTLPSHIQSYRPGLEHAGKPAPSDKQAKPPARSIFKRFLLFILVLILGVGIGLFVWDARNITSASSKLFGSSNLISLIAGGQLNGSDRGRVNVLFIGYSVDDPGHSGANLTDSIIVLSMSPTSKQGYMLSIPRDLYVAIPGFGHAKINEAYQDGGVSLLEQAISSDFQIPIDYYALVNYTSVRDTVNALGGVTVNVQSSDPRGLYDPNISPVDGGPLKLANGPQKLDGQTALNLTRARGDAFDSYGFAQADFDRTEHQRQVLAAIKSRVSWKLVLNPRQNSQILDAIANNIKTDVGISDARPLFGLYNSIPATNMQSLSLRQLNGHNYLASYTTPTGQSALIPASGLDDFSQINDALSSYNQ